MNLNDKKTLLSTGDIAGDYIIDSFIGAGAYGEVYRVHDGLNKNFALKILFNSTMGASEREIKGLTDLRNMIRAEKGLPIIYHIGKFNNYFYYTMDLADNASGIPCVYEPDTLESRLQKKGHLSAPECFQLLRDLLTSLEALHRNNLVHRDLKPSNIIYLNQTAMPADLGLVTSEPRSIVGTMGFLPPFPQGGPTLESEKEGDLYSLGKILYCAFSGEPVERYPLLPPYYSVDDFAMIRPLYLKACADSAEKRFHSCAEFSAAVYAAEHNKKVHAKKSGSAKKILAFLVIMAVIALAGFLYWHRNMAPKSLPAEKRELPSQPMEEACLKITFDKGIYQILCCFSCKNLQDKDPHARANQFMAAGFLKSGLSKELNVPADKKLKIRYGKYLVQPFREGDLLVYMYQIAKKDCLIIPYKTTGGQK